LFRLLGFCYNVAISLHYEGEAAMTDQIPPLSTRQPGLVEYALIVALIAVLVIGILIVLYPATSYVLRAIGPDN
jgi:hypothetical protein